MNWTAVISGLIDPLTQIWTINEARNNTSAGAYTNLPPQLEYEYKDPTGILLLVSGVFVMLIIVVAIVLIKNRS